MDLVLMSLLSLEGDVCGSKIWSGATTCRLKPSRWDSRLVHLGARQDLLNVQHMHATAAVDKGPTCLILIVAVDIQIW